MVQFSSGKSWRWAIVALLTGGLAACQTGQSQPLRPEPLPQDELIQVYTNHEPSASYTEPYRQQTRDGHDLEQILIDTIAQAERTVDVAVQELRLPKVAAALVERQQAGVNVRVILENTYARPFSQFTPAEVNRLPDRERSRYQEFRELVDRDQDGQLSPAEVAQGDALVILDRAKVPRIDDRADGSAGSNLMHHKFLVVDDRTLIVTSANWTTSDVHGDFKTPSSQGNANNLLKINSPELAKLFTQEFNLMWGDGVGGKPDSRFGVKKPFRPARSLQVGQTRVDVQFSPSSRSIPWEQTSNGLIGKTLATAQQSIEMALFVFSDQPLVNQIRPRHQQGVEIRALIDPQFAYRSYSEGLDMLGIVLPENCQLEPGNTPWQPAIASVGVPRMPLVICCITSLALSIGRL
ncbi:phospholipase D-like domain-containing protein [Pantanalinema rosaneae CENA516]|uniref:phospholipase D-like domain-containing protein n=1 Tax=Pantanalinema rosaneae TaxID=1620701 RepID=UPI003D6F1721